jgi:hypothetical protein
VLNLIHIVVDPNIPLVALLVQVLLVQPGFEVIMALNRFTVKLAIAKRILCMFYEIDFICLPEEPTNPSQQQKFFHATRHEISAKLTTCTAT